MSAYPEPDHLRVPLFEEMTSQDIAAAVAANAPVIVPLGATEQHGAHLPLGTDTYQGLDMCRRASALLGREGQPLVVGPAIPFGPPPFLSESPKALPGTVNISNDTLRALLRDVCQSLIGHGFRRIYLLLANVESEYAMHIVAKELTETTPANVVTLNWLIGVRPGYKGGPCLRQAAGPWRRRRDRSYAGDRSASGADAGGQALSPQFAARAKGFWKFSALSRRRCRTLPLRS